MSGSYHPLHSTTCVYARQPPRSELHNESERERETPHALVDHERTDLHQLALDHAPPNQLVLLVEVRDELGAVVAPIALRCEDELARLVPRELLALEQDLERGPDRGGGRGRAVHVDGPEGEAGPDGLVDVDDWRARGSVTVRSGLGTSFWDFHDGAGPIWPRALTSEA